MNKLLSVAAISSLFCFNEKRSKAHFWMCPIVADNRFYVGRWGHDGRAIVKDDVLKSVVKTALRKNAKGYTVEIFAWGEVTLK